MCLLWTIFNNNYSYELKTHVVIITNQTMISFLFCIIIYITGIYGQKVYVYEDPAVDWSYLLDCYEEQNAVSILLDERVEHAQNTGEVWMHKNALLYENRVFDPVDADFFYVPMYIAISSNMDLRSGSLMCKGLTHSQRLEKALDFITKSLCQVF